MMHADSLGPLIRIEGHFNAERYLQMLDDNIYPYLEQEFPDGNFYYYQGEGFI